MKVQHPSFPDIIRDVSNGKAWLAAGWVRMDVDSITEPVMVVTEQGPELFVPETCPTCGAAGGEPCVTSAGKHTSKHASRK